MSDANFSELVNFAYGNITEGAESFTETTAVEGSSIGAIVVVAFICLMVILVLSLIVVGLFKIIKG